MPAARAIAPDIFRQRLLLEGYYGLHKLDEATVKAYLLGLAKHLQLQAYGEPVVFSPASGMGKEENAAYDAFLPLIDSGISAYFWSKQRFYSVVLYICKGFDAEAAEAFTRSYLACKADGERVCFSF